MIILLDTSTPICRLTIVDEGRSFDYEWQADRELAKYIHGWLQDRLVEHEWTWQDLQGIGVFAGPGSFTGLRIGLTVMNTLADSLHVPIVGTTGDDWRDDAIGRLKKGENDHIVLPRYGAEANITTPRK